MISRRIGFSSVSALLLASTVVAAGCKGPIVEEAETASFVRHLRNPVALQGEPFVVTVVAFVRGSNSSSQPPASTRIEPAPGSGVEVVGGPVIVDGALEFTLVGRKEGKWEATVVALGTDYLDSRVFIEIRPTEVVVAGTPAAESAGDVRFIPLLPDEEATVRYTPVGPDGCARPQGATLGAVEQVDWDVALQFARDFGPIRVAGSGCEDAPEGALEAAILYGQPALEPSEATLTYTIQADPVISESVRILGIPSFVTRMVEVPTPLAGTFTRTDEGSCQPFLPGTVDLEWQVSESTADLLRLVTPDGSAYTQVGNAGSEFAFLSGATVVAQDVEAKEYLKLRFDMTRLRERMAIGVSGRATITFTQISTGLPICDQTAAVDAVGELIPGALDWAIGGVGR